ncbi:MAG: sugar kinase [bacterium]
MYDIVTIGDIKLDTFIVLPEASLSCTLKDQDCLLCLAYGKKITVDAFAPQIAGSAANVAVGASRLGSRTAIYSVMGDDETTDLAFKKLGREGVDTRYVSIKKDANSSFSIVLTYKGNRTILAKHEPNVYTLPKIDETKWLYLSELGTHYHKLFDKLPEYIKAKGIKLAFNPGTIQLQAGAKALSPILKATEVLFVNLEEAEMLLGIKDHNEIEKIIKLVWKLGPNIVVISDGARGAYAFDGGKIYFHPSLPVKVVEATGAGDSLGCGFVAAFIEGKKIQESLAWGIANASSVITQVGPQAGLLTRAGIDKVLKKHTKVHLKEI